ncbi:hypothetical protein PF002_g19852 [Phytophthora fragariae]|uniref:BZIP domain-containing protein n=1 Tax=Phytophthora fragariae TaxID=53985 RepID=A0A6A3XR59_9STRA|nr:hypothetical protein PF002_g19852 [Phytophthora fragariae]
MPSAVQTPASDEPLQSSGGAADFEMFCEQLVSRGVGLSIELADAAADALQSPLVQRTLTGAKESAVDAVSRVWRWLQHTLDRQKIEVSKEELLLPQPVVLPFGLPHMDNIAEGIRDMKTDLQLIHETVSQLKEGQIELRRLLKRPMPTPAQCACCAVTVDAPPSTAPSSTRKQDVQVLRFSETMKLHLQRLELPVSVVKPSIAQSSADLLETILESFNNFGAADQHESSFQDAIQESSDDSSDSSRLERRRAQSRTRQLRYLERKRQYERGLLASVDTLQSEVRSLQSQLDGFRHGELERCACPTSANASLPPSPTAALPTSSILQTARDLVHCFRSGFAPTESHPWLPCASPTQEQVRFVQQVVHPDVSNGELRGQNSFLEQWRRYTAFFGSLALHPQSFSMLPGNVGHAVCQTQLTLSLLLESSAFQHVFPHLLQPQHSTLLQRLSNQQLHALRPLLASYEDVAAVLHDALISPCGHIGRDVQRVRDVRLQVSFMLSPS